jgi:hypothetical protein
MSRRRRKERLDKLDAALDGRLVEVDDDLAPLIETAAELRAALAGVELAPEAAERHLGMVLDGEAQVVPLPTRQRLRASQWRRRVAAVALAAALTVLPVTMASASALPGQALYPVKLAVEQLRVTAVSWSSTWEANQRLRITDTRLSELNRLIQLNAAEADRIPPAVVRLHQAHVDAQQAVGEAMRDTGDASQARALDVQLAAVTTGSAVLLHRLQDKLDQGAAPGQHTASHHCRYPAVPRHPRSRQGHTAAHPHDRRANCHDAYRIAHHPGANYHPGTNHHPGTRHEHLPGPGRQRRSRPREQRADRDHPALAPRPEREAGHWYLPGCGPSSTFVAPRLAGSRLWMGRLPLESVGNGRCGRVARRACQSAEAPGENQRVGKASRPRHWPGGPPGQWMSC